MIEPDDDEDWGDATGSPCDRGTGLLDCIIETMIAAVAVSLFVYIAYLLTR